MAFEVSTYAERPDLAARVEDEVGSPWPEFMLHGDVTNVYWPRLESEFPECQLVLHHSEEGKVVGEGATIPVAWDGTVVGLPGGVDDALESGFRLRADGGRATALCALVAIVDPAYQGRGLSGDLIRGMAAVAGRLGLDVLIAPVRPTWKSRYPLTPMERYVEWRREDGLLFDPWLRLHERLGAKLLAVCPSSLTVTGTIAEWEEWTGMAFPESGEYVVEGALVPVEIDRERDVGRYVEPNVWMCHAPA